MSYTLNELKVAAYNWEELPDMTQRERSLWQGLGYAYECYRCGHDKQVCDDLAKNYIKFFWEG